jgi:dihydroorotate dehydrogenase (NAD+) catalytic subunit
MPDLSVEIAGVRFRNPVIVGSSSITSSFEGVETVVRAGAGGVITKTIATDMLPGEGRALRMVSADDGVGVSADQRVPLAEGVDLVTRASEAFDVPIIANVIGHSDNVEMWLKICKRLQAAGAAMIELDLNCHPDDGLELNLPRDMSQWDTTSIGQDAEVTGRLVRGLVSQLDIPVIAKMTLRAPNLLGVAKASAEAGAQVISGVNALHGIFPVALDDGRSTMPGVDDHIIGPICGAALAPLGRRWTAMIAKSVGRPYISGSGVTTARDVVERIMLGSDAVALCTAIYLDGPELITRIVGELDAFLASAGHSSVEAIKGVALARFVERDLSRKLPRVFPRVVDEARWTQVADQVFSRIDVACACIQRADGVIGFDLTRCTGCGLPMIQAGAEVVQMAEPAES